MACWVLDRLPRLSLADLIRGAGRQRQFSIGNKLIAPWAKRIFAEIFAESRFAPAFAVVGRDFDGLDAIAAVPGDPADGRPAPRLDAHAIGRARDERVHGYLGDRGVRGRLLGNKTCHRRKFANRNPVGRLHPVPIEGLGHGRDAGNVLHPIGRGPAGRDDSRRKAVPMRQRLAIHLIGDERRLLDSFPYGKALYEVRRLGKPGRRRRRTPLRQPPC